MSDSESNSKVNESRSKVKEQKQLQCVIVPLLYYVKYGEIWFWRCV